MHDATIVARYFGNDIVCSECLEDYLDQAVVSYRERLAKYNMTPNDDDDGIRATTLDNADPIFADSEHDSYPVCDVCAYKIEDVQLTPDGLAYERRLEHEHLEQEEDEYKLTPEQQAYADQQTARLEKRGLKFGIIYSVDLKHTEANWIKCYQPWQYDWPGGGKDGPPHPEIALWNKTEGDSEYEYDYLEGDWVGGIHRKYLACLDKEQFRAFMDHTYLRFETENTMGSLGGPTPDEPSGGYSVQPAIAFRDDSGEDGVIISAYITPFWAGAHVPDDRDWDRIVEMLRSKYS